MFILDKLKKRMLSVQNILKNQLLVEKDSQEKSYLRGRLDMLEAVETFIILEEKETCNKE